MSVRWTLSSAQLASILLISGKNGVNLYVPESYLGLGVPDMPNFIMYVGSTWSVENGTVTGPLLLVSEYAVQIIKMQKDHIKRWVPKQDIIDSFNEHAQEWIKHTVWKEDCRSWYKNNDISKVNGLFTEIH